MDLDNGRVEECAKQHMSYLKNINELEDLDFVPISFTLIGSRAEGTNRTDSDIDVLLLYKGNARKDDMFNALHREDTVLEIDGLTVDFMPMKLI